MSGVDIKAECSKRLGPEYRWNRASEVIGYIRTRTYVKRREESPNIIPLANGLLNLNDTKLKSYVQNICSFTSCLYRDYFIAKALMLVGGGANENQPF